jgi:hypothetical protein
MSEVIKPLAKPRETRPPLTFTEGFNFGLGFWVAGFLFLTIGVPILTVLAFIALAMIGASFGN